MDAGVAVVVEPDGSGTVTATVTLDADAAAQLGDPATAIRTDDLTAAGWKVTGPASTGDTTTISVAKPFATPERMGDVLRELGGDSGPMADWDLFVDNSFTTSTYRIEGTVELTGSLDQFSDERVAAALDGFAVGRSPDELKAALAENPEALTFTVEVGLPGELEAVEGLTRPDPDVAVATKRFVLADGTPTSLRVVMDAEIVERSSVLWVLIGIGLVVAAVLVVATGRRRPKRRPRPAPEPA